MAEARPPARRQAGYKLPANSYKLVRGFTNYKKSDKLVGVRFYG
jgi:hypothetical protein